MLSLKNLEYISTKRVMCPQLAHIDQIHRHLNKVLSIIYLSSICPLVLVYHVIILTFVKESHGQSSLVLFTIVRIVVFDPERKIKFTTSSLETVLTTYDVTNSTQLCNSIEFICTFYNYFRFM